MLGNSFPVKRLAMTVAAFAVVAVAGVATVSIIPAMAAGAAAGNATTVGTTTTTSGQAGKTIATRRIALALFRVSVEQTGLSRTTVLKDLLGGETLAQIDGSKAQAVESAVMTKISARLAKAVSKGTITQAQATALSAAATAGIAKLMNLNLSTYIHVHFGGFPRTPATTPSAAAATGSSLPL
jgi:hypothetical protein